MFQTQAEDRLYDVLIIGGGPAGASAAMYAARSGLSVLVLDKAPSTGALAITQLIANYPGVEGELTGLELLERMRRQAAGFGATFVQTSTQGVYLDGAEKEIYTPEAVYRGKSVIIAVGARGRNKLLPGEEELLGRGVSYCATCDGAFYKGREVAVIGDNEEAVHEAEFLTRFASTVHLIVPLKKLWGVEELPDLPNLKIYLQTKATAVEGDQKVTGLAISGPTGTGQLAVDGVFIFLSGSKPGTDFLGGQVPLDSDGYLQCDETMATPVPGVFAAGDARKTPVKQAVLAAADGALAAIAADKYVNSRSRLVAQR